MTTVNPKLISDIARLVGKYKPSDWQALANMVEDKDTRATLAALLDEFALASERHRERTTRRPATSSTPGEVRDRLVKLREVDPTRADVLGDLWMKLRSRELLPDMPAVRAFSDAIGMKTLASSRREYAISEVVNYLAALPEDELQFALGRATLSADRRLGEEYKKWVALILRQEPQPPSG